MGRVAQNKWFDLIAKTTEKEERRDQRKFFLHKFLFKAQLNLVYPYRRMAELAA